MNLLNPVKKFGLIAMLALIVASSAHAGADTTFGTVLTMLTDWAQGSLGAVLSIAAFIIGMGIGLVRQSVMAVVVGLSMAIVMFYGPTIITNIVSFAV